MSANEALRFAADYVHEANFPINQGDLVEIEYLRGSQRDKKERNGVLARLLPRELCLMISSYESDRWTLDGNAFPLCAYDQGEILLFDNPCCLFAHFRIFKDLPPFYWRYAFPDHPCPFPSTLDLTFLREEMRQNFEIIDGSAYADVKGRNGYAGPVKGHGKTTFIWEVVGDAPSQIDCLLYAGCLKEFNALIQQAFFENLGNVAFTYNEYAECFLQLNKSEKIRTLEHQVSETMKSQGWLRCHLDPDPWAATKSKDRDVVVEITVFDTPKRLYMIKDSGVIISINSSPQAIAVAKWIDQKILPLSRKEQRVLEEKGIGHCHDALEYLCGLL